MFVNIPKATRLTVERLGEGVLPGRDVDEHQRLGVAAERRLQQVRQLRVPVRNVRVLKRKPMEFECLAGKLQMVDIRYIDFKNM